MEKKKSFDQSSFIGKTTVEISKNYKINKVLGEGAYSVVYLARHRISKILRCVKKIKKSNFTKDQNESIMNEIKVLKQIDHPNILKIFEYYEKKNNLYLVTEHLDGGELFDRIEKYSKFSEKKAAYIFRQILCAVSYMHDKNIAHRDLKPENILF